MGPWAKTNKWTRCLLTERHKCVTTSAACSSGTSMLLVRKMKNFNWIEEVGWMDGWMDSLDLHRERAHQTHKMTHARLCALLTQMGSHGRGFVYSVDCEFTITLRSRGLHFFSSSFVMLRQLHSILTKPFLSHAFRIPKAIKHTWCLFPFLIHRVRAVPSIF